MSARRSWIRWGGVGAALCALSLLSCKDAVMEPLTVAAVEVAGGGVNLRLGQTAQLTPTLKSAKGYVLPKVGISWSSSDGAKASISPSGQVTAVSRGPVTLTATAGGVNGTAAVTVIGVQSITLAPETLSVIVTQTRAMTATTVLDPGVTVTPTWRSLDTTIARVGTDGRVTATSTTGIARIEVTAEDKKDTAVVRVVPVPVVSVVVSPDTATRSVGQTLQLTATPKDSIGGTLTGRAVTWSSSDTARAAVSTAGLVTVKAAGTATITAAAEGKTGSATLTLKVPVADVTVSQTSCTGSGSFSGGTGQLYTSETCQYGALVRDAAGNTLTDRAVTWTLSDTTVAKIDGAPFTHPTTTVSTVKLLPRKAGIITLTAAAEGKLNAASLTILVPVNSVIISPATPTLSVGIVQQLTATPRDNSGGTLNGRNVVWRSSDPTRATVSNTGQVEAIAPGKATISATVDGAAGNVEIEIVTDKITEWTARSGGNSHWYEVVIGAYSWAKADSIAKTRTRLGLSGHLVTLTSAAENNYVLLFAGTILCSSSCIGVNPPFIGAYQDRTATNYSEPSGGWRWVTGEPFNYTAWRTGEPNNSSNIEDYIYADPIRPGGDASKAWNDYADITKGGDALAGFIIEYENSTLVRTCKDIQGNGPEAISGNYSLYPTGQFSSETLALCDMATDRGGWTKTLGHKVTDDVARLNSPQNEWGALRLAAVDSGSIHPDKLQELRSAGKITELRFMCTKPSLGRKIHIKTNNPSVLDYFFGVSSSGPSSVGSFSVYADDNSILSRIPELWGDVSGGAWGWRSTVPRSERFINHPIFHVANRAWLLYMWTPPYIRNECDDYMPYNPSANGTWEVWVR